MSKLGLEVFLEGLITEIAYSGEEGVSINELFKIVRKYHLSVNDPEAAASQDAAAKKGSQNDVEHAQVLESSLSDAEMASAQWVWDYLRTRPQILINGHKRYNRLEWSQVLALPETAPEPAGDSIDPKLKAAATKASTKKDKGDDKEAKPKKKLTVRPRIHPSQDLVWQTLTHHGVDYKRVPPLEWACLQGVATAKREGILQSDLRRLVNQDKRSLPKRTDSLARKGYIVKRTLVVRKMKTSKLWLVEFAPPTVEAAHIGLDLSPQALAGSTEAVEWHDRWTGDNIDMDALGRTVMGVIKAFGVIRYADLRNKMGVSGMTWQMKTLAKSCQRFADLGVVKYTAASFPDNRKIFKDCLKFIRDLTDEEWDQFLATGKKTSQYSDPTRHREPKPNALALYKRSGTKKGGLRIHNRWTPEKPLAQTVFEVIKTAGPEGASNPQVSVATVGYQHRRYLSSYLTKVADTNQPPHLQKFQVKSELVRSGKTSAYMYRATGDQRGAKQPPAPSEESSPSDFGFGAVRPKTFASGEDISFTVLADHCKVVHPKSSRKINHMIAQLARATTKAAQKAAASAPFAPPTPQVQPIAEPGPAVQPSPEAQAADEGKVTAPVQSPAELEPRPSVSTVPLASPALESPPVSEAPPTPVDEIDADAPTSDMSLKRKADEISGSNTEAEDFAQLLSGAAFEARIGEPNSLDPKPRKRGAFKKSVVVVFKNKNKVVIPKPEVVVPPAQDVEMDVTYHGVPGKLELNFAARTVSFLGNSPKRRGKKPVPVRVSIVIQKDLESPVIGESPVGDGKSLVFKTTTSEGDASSISEHVFIFEDDADNQTQASLLCEKVAELKSTAALSTYFTDGVTQDGAAGTNPDAGNATRGRGGACGGARRGRKYKPTGTGPKPYVCEKCGKSWKNDIGLKYHLEKSQDACNPNFDPAAILDRRRKQPSPSQAPSVAGSEPRRRPVRDRVTGRLRKAKTTQRARRKKKLAVRRLRARPIRLPTADSIFRGVDWVTEILPDTPPASVSEKTEGTIVWQPQPTVSLFGAVSLPVFSLNNQAQPVNSRTQLAENQVKFAEINPSYLAQMAYPPSRVSFADQRPVSVGTTVTRDATDVDSVQHTATYQYPDVPNSGTQRQTSKSATQKPGQQKPGSQRPSFWSEQESLPLKPFVPSKSYGGYNTSEAKRRSAMALDIINYLVDSNCGVFPGDKSIYYAMLKVFLRTFLTEMPPTLKNCQQAIRNLEARKEIVSHTHMLRTERGTTLTYVLLLRTGVDKNGTIPTMTRQKIQQAYPNLYIPKAFSPSPEELAQLQELDKKPSVEDKDSKPNANGQKFRHRRKITEIETFRAPYYTNSAPPPEPPARSSKDIIYTEPLGRGSYPRRYKRSADGPPSGSPPPKRTRTKSSYGTYRHVEDDIPVDPGLSAAAFSQGEQVQRKGEYDQNDNIYRPTVVEAVAAWGLLPSRGARYVKRTVREITKLPRALGRIKNPGLASLPGSFFTPGSHFHNLATANSTEFAIDPQLANYSSEPAASAEEQTKESKESTSGSRTAKTGNLPESAEDIAQKGKSDVDLTDWADKEYGKFCSAIDQCAEWEQSAEGFAAFQGATAAPAFQFINFTAPEAIANNKPVEGLWATERQFDLETLPYEDLEDPNDYGLFKAGRATSAPDGTKKRRGRQPGSTNKNKFRPAKHKLQAIKTARELTPYPKSPEDFLRVVGDETEELDWLSENVRLATFIVVTTLLGGVNRVVDWGLMLRLMPDQTISQLRHYWCTLKKDRSSTIVSLSVKFRKAFLKAYENNELPPFDFNNPLAYDWKKLIKWTTELDDKERRTLPGSRAALQEQFKLSQGKHGDREWREAYYHAQRSVFNRFQDATSEALASSIDAVPDTKLSNEMVVAMAWNRSLCVTPAEPETSEVVIHKRNCLYPGKTGQEITAIMEKAIEKLQRMGVVSKSSTKWSNGRIWRFNTRLLDLLEKNAQQEKFAHAFQHKKDVDEAFRANNNNNNNRMRVTYITNDGMMMALLNMQAMGRIRFETTGQPNVPMGHEPGNYETRKYPKKYLHFRTDIVPTETYLFNDSDELVDLASRIKAASPPTLGPGGAIPAWCDVFGKVNNERWLKHLSMVLITLATRGSMRPEELVKTLKPVIMLFEVELILEWAEKLGLLSPQLEGTAPALQEWWWLAVEVHREGLMIPSKQRKSLPSAKSFA
ncbi:hypothetical protein QBC35DRAFT_293632 [Podospora australis]|uniref:C2H2-type domain-containing protein n=1 Tax=Podospora australis TaxID=1536484 RepID=A0AAN6X0Z0_9PEZI|nr:hypothetical protein QBC35DRAFT_293632 [Podospora australis]